MAMRCYEINKEEYLSTYAVSVLCKFTKVTKWLPYYLSRKSETV